MQALIFDLDGTLIDTVYAHVFSWQRGRWRWPLRAVSRWRCARDFYGFPLEKRLVELMRPPAPVS